MEIVANINYQGIPCALCQDTILNGQHIVFLQKVGKFVHKSCKTRIMSPSRPTENGNDKYLDRKAPSQDTLKG